MRLFVALNLPHATRQRLADLASGVPGARWVPPENYHVTLRFIGETPRHLAAELDLALAAVRVRQFALALGGTGTVEKGGRVTGLRIGVARDQALDHLQAKIETALQRAGLAPERRRFIPHVTMARLHNAAEPHLAAWVQAHNLARLAPVPIQHFTLFSAQLGKEQAAYTPEVDYALE